MTLNVHACQKKDNLNCFSKYFLILVRFFSGDYTITVRYKIPNNDKFEKKIIANYDFTQNILMET